MYIVHLKEQLGAIFTTVILLNKDNVHVENAQWYTEFNVYNRHLIKQIEQADIPMNAVFMIESESDDKDKTANLSDVTNRLGS